QHPLGQLAPDAPGLEVEHEQGLLAPDLGRIGALGLDARDDLAAVISKSTVSRTSRSEFGTSATAEIVPTRMSKASSPAADTTGFTGAGVNAISEAFELCETVKVVPGEQADHGAQLLGPPLGMDCLAVEV